MMNLASNVCKLLLLFSAFSHLLVGTEGFIAPTFLSSPYHASSDQLLAHNDIEIASSIGDDVPSVVDDAVSAGTDKQLTLDPETEELVGSVLADALHQMNTIMDIFFMTHCPDESLQRMFRNCMECVEPKQSTIPNAGRGLFATVDIPAGQVVSFYPVHTLGVTVDGSVNYSVTLEKNGEEQAADGTDDDANDNNVANSAYTLNLLGQRPVAGVNLEKYHEDIRSFADVKTSRPIIKGWMAHFINDGAIVTKENDTMYYENSLSAQNCVIAPFGPAPVLVAVTTKSVNKGEELFASYGYSYWANAIIPDISVADIMAQKSPEILNQEKRAYEDLYKTFDKLNEMYEEESDSLEAAFDAFIAQIKPRTLL